MPSVDKPLISVILTTYNRCHLLPRAINSVLGGTYDNFELIIIDDASSDRTPEVVSQLTDRRIQHRRMQDNGGVLRARNRGFDMARGDYVTILDDDDELLPNALGTVAEEFDRTARGGIDILWFDCLDVEAGRISGSIRTNEGNIRFEDYVCGRIEGDFWLVFSRRALNGNRFCEALRAHESLLWLKIHKRFSARYVPTVLCKKYRQHGGERLCAMEVRMKQLHETTLALRLHLQEFGDDIRQGCPAVFGFRLAYLGLHELMIDDRSSGRRSILRSLRYRFSVKYLVLLVLSWFVGSKTVIAIYRRIEGSRM
jgi:glycosyltransferase involved in cell wall biosynthesis